MNEIDNKEFEDFVSRAYQHIIDIYNDIGHSADFVSRKTPEPSGVLKITNKLKEILIKNNEKQEYIDKLMPFVKIQTLISTLAIYDYGFNNHGWEKPIPQI